MAGPTVTTAESDASRAGGAFTPPAEKLWGAQTERARHFFAISVERFPLEVILALAEIKRAAAIVNADLGLLDRTVAAALVAAADEVLARTHDGEFPLSLWQSGSGTQSNMNVNEVLANRAMAIASAAGRPIIVHPNDDVNRGQSSNDTVPAAMHLAALRGVRDRLLPALDALHASLRAQAGRHAGVIKLGRTHLQDALPMRFGEELGAFASQIAHARSVVARAAYELHALPLGGTAVGTGFGADPRFAAAVVAVLSGRAGFPFTVAADRFALIAAHDPMVALHGALRVLAVALSKIANDLRLLASGPRAGLAEVVLPANEPGSSIMPGKVNPTQCESLAMIACLVFGNDAAMAVAGSIGHLQLNTAKPLIAHLVLQSVAVLGDGVSSFTRNAIAGLAPDAERMRHYVERSLMLATALSAHIGYDRAAQIARQAADRDITLREAAIEAGVAATDFDRWVQPERMLGSEPVVAGDQPGRL